MRAKLLLLLTTLAFVASLFVVPPPATAGGKRGDAAISAARLAMVHAANVVKPSPRKAEGTTGSALTPRISSVEPATYHLVTCSWAPREYVRSAPDRSELMVFLI